MFYFLIVFFKIGLVILMVWLIINNINFVVFGIDEFNVIISKYLFKVEEIGLFYSLLFV